MPNFSSAPATYFQGLFVASQPFSTRAVSRIQRHYCSVLHGAFPVNSSSAALGPRRFLSSLIDLPVTINFRGPEVGAGRGQPEQMTVVPVPETAMGKQHRAISRKDQIGLARQTAIMKTEPAPRSMQSAPKNNLRLCVGSMDDGTHPAADVRGENGSHLP